MIIKKYIKDFENLGFGMFVHFGLYSLIGKGEWSKHNLGISDEEYYSLMKEFDPKPDWAEQLVKTAKNAGCKYITITTRHHDGFSLFDTCGLSDLDAMHAKCGRDLIKEFVTACRNEDIIPFFYHTLLDWHQEYYKTDFPKYLKYLRDSVEILCKNYGKIGGLWFDGMWDRWDSDWEEDALYATIRKHQPEAMIINNTGLDARGAVGNIEIDSVTFERGNPKPINTPESPKYLASEMCEVLNSHWGFAKEDINYKSPSSLIETFADCRKYGANLLLNIGPMGDGSTRPIDAAYLGVIGEWVNYFEEALREPRPTDIVINGNSRDFLLSKDNNYYLFSFGNVMEGDANVVKAEGDSFNDVFELPKEAKKITWLDNGEEVNYTKDGNKIMIGDNPYHYGRNLVVRVAKIEC